MSRKEHLKPEGLRKIVSLRASLNEGLTPILKESFADITPVLRPVVEDQEVKDPHWLSGFVSGDGCFYVQTSSQVQLRFSVAQHTRDIQLMDNLINYLGCGWLSKRPNLVELVVGKFSDIESKIIPFFSKYPVVGTKKLDFDDFCAITLLMKNKEHLTDKGLMQIKNIKAGMNKGRESN